LPQLPGDDRALDERFAYPPASSRILRILHSQKEDPRLQDQQLRELAEQGFGGFAGNVAFNGYVDDESKWPAFVRGVSAAKAAGMSLWLYDECGYPSGSARDLTLKDHPEFGARGLLIASTNVAGGAVSLQLPPGELLLAAAYPRRNGVIDLKQVRDLRASVADGRLSCQLPAGEWFVAALTHDVILEGTHIEASVAFRNPYINLLMKDATARFLEVNHDAYANHMGANLGKYFLSTFTDEPSLMSYWFKPMPFKVLPWSVELPSEFKARYGKELLPLLPALVTNAGGEGAQIRYAFWEMIADLVSENYFGQIQRWCKAHDLLSGGHLLMEENFGGYVPLYGDFFRCVRRLDAPSMDCLTSIPGHVSWYAARLISSVAELERRSVRMSEASDHSQQYRKEGDARPKIIVTEDQIRGSLNRQLWGGITTFTSYYHFTGLDDNQLRRINSYVGRCSTMLKGGYQVCDVAVLYPIESAWVHYEPSYHGVSSNPEAIAITKVYKDVGDSLYKSNRDFTYVDSKALNDAKVKSGALTHGDLAWRVLVLPATDTLPLESWRKVYSFWKKGGVVIAVGKLPRNSESAFPSEEVENMAQEMFSSKPFAVATSDDGGIGLLLPSGMASLLPGIIDKLVTRTSWSSAALGPIRVTQRRIDNHDVYFAINDSAEPWSGNMHFGEQGVSEVWNPDTGLMTPLSNEEKNSVAVQLPAYRSLLFRGKDESRGKRISLLSELKIAERIAVKQGEPGVGHGTYVTSSVSGNDSEGWISKATLTKGDVDTHLFMDFPIENPDLLSACEGFVFDVTLPEGQTADAQLLVMAATQSGAVFIASTGHYLNRGGSQRLHVGFSQFSLFKEGNGDASKQLDLSKVNSVRFGWGGYFGKEGEKIEFRVGLPQCFAVE